MASFYCELNTEEELNEERRNLDRDIKKKEYEFQILRKQFQTITQRKGTRAPRN